MFRRRERRGILRATWELLWPRGGWSRAFGYVKLRLRRLPGTPEQIARGVWAGVFASFTPLYGLHFVVASLLALVLRGSVLASLIATFFGNPLTYVPIGAVSLGLGYLMLGRPFTPDVDRSLGGKFVDAAADLWNNFMAIFTPAKADWSGLIVFWDDIFFPWLIGGIIPGVISATICYYLAVPVIRAYQNRRKGRLADRLAGLRKKASRGRDAKNQG